MGIFDGHYDDKHIRAENDGVSFNNHRGFGKCDKVLNVLIEQYPHITCKGDIRHMNDNAPLEASNLNNPCKHVMW